MMQYLSVFRGRTNKIIELAFRGNSFRLVRAYLILQAMLKKEEG
jgi:hypothetical protein